MIPPILSRRSFLKASAMAGGGSIAASLWQAPASAAAAGGPLIAYVGTYSSPLPFIRAGQVDLPAGNGKGIYSFLVDRATGALTPHGLFELATSPNCLAINAAGTRLYSTDETDLRPENEAGSISSFAIDRATGKLTLLNTVSSGGAGPAHLSIHPSGKFVLVANYFGGSVAVLPILPDGSLGAVSDFKQDAGTIGPKKATSAPPGSFAVSGHDQVHEHMIAGDPSGRFVISVEMGMDQLRVWKFDDKAGVLTANDPHAIALPPGDGPRHFSFHPNGYWFYSLQEEGSTIVLFDYDGALGRLAPRQTISSLPPGFAGSNFTSEIAVSDDGRFVYVANRLHDSIAFFAVDEKTGALTFVGEEWTRGDYPRSFGFDPTGTFLYSLNQRADNIAIFKVDRKAGALTFTGQITPVGNPSSIVFLDLGKAG
ncbi:MAG: lactonase family protein [Chthoniobacter sp.]|uniref:lactonase family protein n=1 Tax=Chthoniobacter sp. TaxID=2510640 RepID=UPI0032AD947B